MKPMRPVRETYYEDFRVSYAVIAVCLIIMGIISMNALLGSVGPKHLALIAALILLLAATFCVRVVSDGETLSVSYGVGLIAFTVSTGDLATYRIPPNRYLRTWLYTPLASHALELIFRGGGRIIVPAEDPKALAVLLRVKP